MEKKIATLAALVFTIGVAFGQETDTTRSQATGEEQPANVSSNDDTNEGSSSSDNRSEFMTPKSREIGEENRYPRGNPNSTGYGSGLNMGTGAGTGRDTVNHRDGSSSYENNRRENHSETQRQGKDQDDLYPRGNPNSAGYGSGLNMGTGAGTGRDTVDYRQGSTSSDEDHLRRGEHSNRYKSGTLSTPPATDNSRSHDDAEDDSEQQPADTAKSKKTLLKDHDNIPQ